MLYFPKILISSGKKKGKGRGKLTEPGSWLSGCGGEEDWGAGDTAFCLTV